MYPVSELPPYGQDRQYPNLTERSNLIGQFPETCLNEP
jgi:hypothetical protein